MRETRQRMEVLEVLEGGDALPAQELHGRLRARGSKVGLATVYRTLHLLEREGSIDVLREDPTEARYRLCCRPAGLRERRAACPGSNGGTAGARRGQ